MKLKCLNADQNNERLYAQLKICISLIIMVSKHNVPQLRQIIFTKMKYKRISKHCFTMMEKFVLGDYSPKGFTDNEIIEKILVWIIGEY